MCAICNEGTGQPDYLLEEDIISGEKHSTLLANMGKIVTPFDMTLRRQRGSNVPSPTETALPTDTALSVTSTVPESTFWGPKEPP